VHRSTVRNKVVADLLQRHLSRGRVLEVGAGSGELSHLLREKGYHVEAADIDPSQCDFPDIDIRKCDVMEGLPYPDEVFDAVVAMEFIEHMEDPFRAVREFNRVLSPGGLLVLTTPNYGNVETRLRYLVQGTLPRALPIELSPPDRGRAHHHVSPFSVMRLKYLLMNNGFEPEHLTTCLPKKKSWLLAPLAGLILFIVYGLWSSERREKYHISDQVKTLLGGRSLVWLSEKKLDCTPNGGESAVRSACEVVGAVSS
jgi:SAM-dependent methyltransferase